MRFHGRGGTLGAHRAAKEAAKRRSSKRVFESSGLERSRPDTGENSSLWDGRQRWFVVAAVVAIALGFAVGRRFGIGFVSTR